MSGPQTTGDTPDTVATEVRATVEKLLEVAGHAPHPLIALDALLHAYANAAVMSGNGHRVAHAFKTMLEDLERQGLIAPANKHLH